MQTFARKIVRTIFDFWIAPVLGKIQHVSARCAESASQQVSACMRRVDTFGGLAPAGTGMASWQVGGIVQKGWIEGKISLRG